MGGKKNYSTKRIKDKPTHAAIPKPSDYSLPNSKASSSNISTASSSSTIAPRPRIISSSIGYSRDGWVLEGRQPGCILNRKLSRDTLSHILIEDNLIVLGIPMDPERSTVSTASKWKTNVGDGVNGASTSSGPAFQSASGYQTPRGGATGSGRFESVMENVRLSVMKSQGSKGIGGSWSAPASAVGSFTEAVKEGGKGKGVEKDAQGVKQFEGKIGGGNDKAAVSWREKREKAKEEHGGVEKVDEGGRSDMNGVVGGVPAKGREAKIGDSKEVDQDGAAGEGEAVEPAQKNSNDDKQQLTAPEGEKVDATPEETNAVDPAGNQSNDDKNHIKNPKDEAEAAAPEDNNAIGPADKQYNESEQESKDHEEGAPDVTSKESNSVGPADKLSFTAEHGTKDLEEGSAKAIAEETKGPDPTDTKPTEGDQDIKDLDGSGKATAEETKGTDPTDTKPTQGKQEIKGPKEKHGDQTPERDNNVEAADKESSSIEKDTKASSAADTGPTFGETKATVDNPNKEDPLKGSLATSVS